ncbi:PREDICTED: protein DMR6-LIKE OXYGENASE 1-like [Prunus mume]|uniref:Protein DMR6-LIKE OXYGENASE 1-like n=1 Tax=Prunus mume TaxID=102107 RepID=A0ABM1LT03_PRUMU|nr:PREDICTED: protein DMR6-LIKE OXYGENASE 1-like [Prunus mume]
MAKTASVVLTQSLSDTKRTTSFNHSTNDDEIPTIDYSMLICSNDPDQRLKSLQYLAYVCEEYGFFYLVNHGVPDCVIERALNGISDFFDLTEEEKKDYEKKNSTDRIRWGLGFSPGDHEAVKREYLKVLPHPKFEGPAKPAGFREALEDYYQRNREVIINLAKAVSKTLGFEENYLEKEFELETGADVSAMNVYPPGFKPNTQIGLPAHVLTNGKYKSPMHRVILNNEVRRISVATVHGPSLDTFVKPGPEFVGESHPPAYRGMIYKDSLEANGYHEIDGKSCMAQLRL